MQSKNRICAICEDKQYRYFTIGMDFIRTKIIMKKAYSAAINIDKAMTLKTNYYRYPQ